MALQNCEGCDSLQASVVWSSLPPTSTTFCTVLDGGEDRRGQSRQGLTLAMKPGYTMIS
jgi:hypothetical protein